MPQVRFLTWVLGSSSTLRNPELEGAPSFAFSSEGWALTVELREPLLFTLAFSFFAASLRTLRRRLPRLGRGVIFSFFRTPQLSTFNYSTSYACFLISDF